MLVTYRNNAIHFYNQQGFSTIIYGLAQTSIINFKDSMHSAFNVDIANEMTISLLPLSFGARLEHDQIPLSSCNRQKQILLKIKQLLNF